jgi:NAD(P)-dependent dehydrogenase (short-subunit alcohol dehydrogenase family)
MQKRPVIVLTGASSGVGRATARELAIQGARLGLVARGLEGLEAAASEAESLGGQAIFESLDVADYKEVDAAADRIERELGPIDVWINNAMATVFSPFMRMTSEEFRRATEVTYLGYVHGTRAALKRMIPRDRGAIVQVGSALAYRGIPLQSAYCGAKHAIQGFTESVRTELYHEHSNIALTMVQLPALNTPQFDIQLTKMPRRARPVPPIYQPEVAARAIVYAAAHPHRTEYSVGASTVATLAANVVARGVLDRYLGRYGYRSQQTDEPANPFRRHNLWEPVPGDHGARGRFDAQAHAKSLQWWLNEHRIPIALAFTGAVAVALVNRRTAHQN